MKETKVQHNFKDLLSSITDFFYSSFESIVPYVSYAWTSSVGAIQKIGDNLADIFGYIIYTHLKSNKHLTEEQKKEISEIVSNIVDVGIDSVINKVTEIADKNDNSVNPDSSFAIYLKEGTTLLLGAGAAVTASVDSTL
ncbi:MAG: hypothetical protein SFT93_06000 [Rickettsiaceae bacterium]|nr:hypothetical protein [Rickettsiaceae bacterium]